MLFIPGAAGVQARSHRAARSRPAPGLELLDAAVPLAGRTLDAWLADGHAHGLEVCDQAVVGLQRAETVQAHLRVALGVDLDTHAVLEVDDDHLGATAHDHVGSAPGLLLGHAQVARVVDADVGKDRAVVALQVVGVVDADLDVTGHVLVDLEDEAIGFDDAPDVGGGGALFLQRPGQDLVRGGALGSVLAGVVRLALLEHLLARAKHDRLEARGRPLAVCGSAH